MNSSLRLPKQLLARVGPHYFEDYLARKGWHQRRDISSTPFHVFTHPAISDAEVLVPLFPHLGDYSLRVAEAFQTVAVVESRHVWDIMYEVVGEKPALFVLEREPTLEIGAGGRFAIALNDRLRGDILLDPEETTEYRSAEVVQLEVAESLPIDLDDPEQLERYQEELRRLTN
jgi:hypothetical protein